MHNVSVLTNWVNYRRFLSVSAVAASASLAVAASCAGPFTGDDAGSAASIRIDTRTPSTLADSDMVVMRASVLDSAGNALPRASVSWKSLSPKIIDVTEGGHLIGRANSGGREAKIVATVSSKPFLSDTTIAYMMVYATTVGLAPNKDQARTFRQIALLAVGESAPVHGTGYVVGQIYDYRLPPWYDSTSVDQTMRWTSRSPQIASVDVKGIVTGRSVGVATIVVQPRGGSALDSGIVVVQQPTLRLTTVIPGDHMCGLAVDGAAWCWGDLATISAPPTAASLGGSRFPALPSGGAKQYSSLSTNGDTACGIATDGITYCWALIGNKAFGMSVANNDPIPFGTDLRFTAIRMGGGSACGLTSDGTLYCWGNNSAGQLGDGTKLSRTEPAPVTGGMRFTAFTINSFLGCGIAVSGDTYCWGLADANGIVSGPNASLAPVKLQTTPKFVELRAQSTHICGRTSGGEVFCWGNNSVGQLGDGTTTSHSTPLPIAGGYRFANLAGTSETSCGLTQEGRAICWGYNEFGTVGDGTFGQARPRPAPVAGDLRFASLAGADARMCGQSNGVFYCWGANHRGTMGINRMWSVSEPTRLAGVLP